MVDFRKLMSPETREYFDRTRAEIARLYRLDDRFLARALIRMSRDIRSRHENLSVRPPAHHESYTSMLVFDIIPEIAYRLGERGIAPDERGGEVRSADDERLRELTSYALNWTPHRPAGLRIDKAGPVDSWDLVTAEPCNGNPVVFGLDRVAPADNLSRDRIACYIRSVSRHRGLEPREMWSPDMNRYRVDDMIDDAATEASGPRI